MWNGEWHFNFVNPLLEDALFDVAVSNQGDRVIRENNFIPNVPCFMELVCDFIIYHLDVCVQVASYLDPVIICILEDQDTFPVNNNMYFANVNALVSILADKKKLFIQ